MLNQIWTDDTYVYAATTSGLEFVELTTEQRAHFVDDLAYTTVWANDTHLFAGTSTAGIKVINLDDVPNTSYTITAPYLSSSNINYLHGNSERLLVATNVGIDSIHLSSGYIITATISNVTKCFITNNNEFYYIVGSSSVNRANNRTSNWTSPDVVYTVGTSFLSAATEIKDIFVTTGTSLSNNDNTLFIATDVGAYVLDEDSGYCTLYTT